MIWNKSKILLLLISTIWLISFGATKNKDEKHEEQLEILKNDSSFQILIDGYCEAKSLKISTEKELTRIKNQINQNNELNAKSIAEQEKNRKYKNGILGKPKTDSTLMANDSLKQAYITKSLLDIAKCDTNIKNLEQSISLRNKQNIDSGKAIDIIQNELAKRKISFESVLKKVKAYASKIQGGLNFKLCDITYNIFVANLDSNEIRMHLFKNEKQNFYSLGSVREYLESKKIEPLMITNAGMFTPSHEPEGLYIEYGSKTQFELDTTKRNTNENFFLSPNGVFFIDTNDIAYVKTTEDFIGIKKEGKIKVKLATQSGPMLLINGNIHPKFTQGSTNEKIRSGVGKINDNKVIFAITINESNFYEFAMFFKEIFGCKDALFLDGAISKMYLKDVSAQILGGNFGAIISVSKKH